ncbi:hypothetical protein SAMN05421803_1438 [Nocardiopsis flavescens]|uniref:Uncharacterized protein n=1 Tax=Nocardiopsis flavescens TaxID=758803 RepID=A0A1M6WEQ9_9ACTN|nr:hypothetical protein [Nocardiopsis flavescens]SHK92242.1 hypothetical protein SAMN05421803_1438 [Nocardiopsis flavescens]
MPDPHPPLEGTVAAIHAALAEPGVHCRPTGGGGHVIEFTETALVAFVADQRAAAWDAALATTTPTGQDTGDGETTSAVEQAVVDLLRNGPRARGEIDRAVMDGAGCARATVSRALDALTRRGTLAPLPGRKGWHLTCQAEHSSAATAVLEALGSQGPMTTTALRQMLTGRPGCGATSVDEALKALSDKGVIAKAHDSRKAPWALT